VGAALPADQELIAERVDGRPFARGVRHRRMPDWLGVWNTAGPGSSSTS
jgi:hypothetical protein